MSLNSLYRGFLFRVRAYSPLLTEAVVSIASLRMAALLTLDPGYFERFSSFYRFLLAHFPQAEWKWGLLALAAGVLKLAGLVAVIAGRRWARIQELGFIARAAGWGLSVVFWSSFCLSISIGDPWSLGSICSATMAMLSLLAMITGPAMLEDDSYGTTS